MSGNEREEELPPPFWDSIEEYKMREKRTYKEILASVETHIIHINNHLGNIDGHLETQNRRLSGHDKAIAKNTTWNLAYRWVVGVIITGLIAGSLALINRFRGL